VKQQKIAGYENAMIIEDEEDLSFLLSIVLKQINVTASCVHTIKEARENIKKLKPSIIFLDNHLPDGKGSDFIAQAKALYPQTKIVMMTAYDSTKEVNEAFTRGADYFITKPFNTAAIKTTINSFIHRPTG
jgi:two-component system response regulator (stage 0 sporulation protein F)